MNLYDTRLLKKRANSLPNGETIPIEIPRDLRAWVEKTIGPLSQLLFHFIRKFSATDTVTKFVP